MKKTGRKTIVTVILIVLAILFGWQIFNRLQKQSGSFRDRPGPLSVPVEVAPIQYGPIELRRTFSGTLESPAEFLVAPEISGRVEVLHVDLGDTVQRGQVVAELDSKEYIQAVRLAEADLAVAKANLVEAQSGHEIATRELKRVATLLESGLASDSEFDSAKAEQLAKQARLEVSRAQVTKAEASLETARIRLGYTKVTAEWTGGDMERSVAERYVDEGQTVSANTPLLSIVELDPITGVIYVTEKDYVYLKPDQPATLTTDAYPGETFSGHADRIAPIFRQATRQARVELKIENTQHRLKPGMFIRSTVVFKHIDMAFVVPEQALTRRNDKDGIFIVSDDGKTVNWCEVEVGIREGDRRQIVCEGLSEKLVVTLGQQLLDDGSTITIANEKGSSAFTTDKESSK